MPNFDFKTATPDTSISGTEYWFGADSQSAATPSIYTVGGLKTYLLGGGSLAITAAKTLTATNSLTLTGTDGTTMTFPSASATLAALGIANLFTTAQTITPSTDVVGLTINSGGTANILELLDSSNNKLSFFDKDGLLTLGRTSALTGQLKFANSTNANILTLQSGATSGSLTFTLPTSDGTSGQVLQTNGSGVLSWKTDATNSPGGSDTQVQYNNSGSFGGSAALTFGSNTLTIGTASTTTGLLALGNAASANLTKIQAGNASSSVTYTLPTADGTNGQVLSTNGSGTLSWKTDSTNSPGGSDTQVQFNNSGSFGGSAALTFTSNTLTIGTPSTTTGILSFGNASSANTTKIQGANASSSVTYTLPTADGSNGQALSTNGSGTLSWSSYTSGAAGSNTQLQFNNSGAFAGDSTLTFNSTSKKLTANSFGLSGNISASAWTTNGIRYANTAATITDTSSSGTVATAYTDLFGGNTIAATNSTTYTDYYTMFVSPASAGSNVAFTNVYALGLGGSLNLTSGNLVFAGDAILSRKGTANLRLGAADVAAPVAQTLSVQSVVGGTNNTAGANLTITGSQGTGSGAGGSIIFQVAPASSSGTSQNTLNTVLSIIPNASGLATNSALIAIGPLSTALRTVVTSNSYAIGLSTTLPQVLYAENTSAYSSTGGAFTGLFANTGSAITSGSRMGGVFFGAASSASSLRSTAIVHGFASENWVDGSAYGSRIEFGTTANTTTSRTTKLIVGNSGILTLGATEANTVPALKPSGTTLQVRLGDDSAFAPISVNNITSNGIVSQTAGTLADGTNAYSLTATMPTSPTSTVIGINYTMTGAGSSSTAGVTAAGFVLAAGYTGSQGTACLNAVNSSASSLVSYLGATSSQSYRINGNRGGVYFANGSTSGLNAGIISQALNSTTANYGIWGTSTYAVNNAWNVGVLGFGLNTGTGTQQIGGYFALYDGGTSAPNLISGALVCDNGTTSSPVFLARVNNATAFQVNSTGSALVVGSGGLGYGTGSGGAVTQATSRTTGVTLNKTNGAITLVSAAGSTSWQTFTVTNSTVAATDTIIVSQKSGTDKNQIFVTAVAAGSFDITFATTGGTTTEQPVFNFAVIKAVAS